MSDQGGYDLGGKMPRDRAMPRFRCKECGYYARERVWFCPNCIERDGRPSDFDRVWRSKD